MADSYANKQWLKVEDCDGDRNFEESDGDSVGSNSPRGLRDSVFSQGSIRHSLSIAQAFDDNQLPDGANLTSHGTGRVLSFNNVPKRKTRAEHSAEIRLAKEIRRKNTWCCQCKICWITALVLIAWSLYFNYVIRMNIYQDQVNQISHFINLKAELHCKYFKWIRTGDDGEGNSMY